MVGQGSHLPSVAYFLIRGPRIRPGRSQRSRSRLENGTVLFGIGKKRLPARKAALRDAKKRSEIEDWLAIEELG